jgi:hypothetical protein
MVRASLYTLYKNADLLPESIVIVSDGSWDPCVGVDYFKKYTLPIECVKWETSASYYQEKCPSLTAWANKHIWGKKMTAILYYSESKKVLFSDPDVLWFGNPFSEMELSDTCFKVSVDNSHNYDNACIKELGLTSLYDTPEPSNCGVVFIHGGLSLLDADALECIDYEANHAGPFAEQTVFALMDRKFDNRWEMKEISSEISDVKHFFSLKPIISNKTMIARHYLWMLKWIYWRMVILEILRYK